MGKINIKKPKKRKKNNGRNSERKNNINPK